MSEKAGASPAGHNLHNLQSVTRCKRTLGKFRRRNRFAVVFDDDASGEKILAHEKIFERAGELRLDLLAVGDDKSLLHAGSKINIRLALPLVLDIAHDEGAIERNGARRKM